ncbi:hypothetical protein MesoLjLc_50940 [Mesorhizobium sp. L-8-10]|uniref:hypothetical protein n=1 Tax=Mesorhizobium sp. L-8-10 TaxID=2744523 RepID=UPI0019259671|nr:hypothetical protein [Mesorhizobium sp. L-8-10]BCH33164.1 hypothetical protein MesoLjLc_50940 [Mesorhizobium sp. L-8-10]
MKLTKAQLQFLRELAEGGHQTVSDAWNPARKLLDLGYAIGEPGKYGSFTVSITEAGRRALEGGGNG